MSCSVVPESFRWLVSHLRTKDAELVIDRVASINGRQKPDVTKLIEMIQKETEMESDRKYSILDIFGNATLAKHSFFLWFIW
jgi:hypothetical protein